MELSILLAQVLGIFYVVVGLGLIFNPSYYRKMYNAIIKDPGALLLSGMIGLLVGVFLILFHNVWVKSWIVIITIFGWAALIKGVFLLILPTAMTGMVKNWFKGNAFIIVAGVGWLIIGLVLGYFGFFA